ncbi:exported protein of unknown function [Modestobacter italicus]|uniref:DUF2933 domain-containing protein n=1 Tax=Modestobacter italicus (strain DSM 44449 / CECT 9708 / BC 501) TaxID=2732864 RepID=I4EUH4_MODI5|nr:hypothetical protein [Modestobacter marinus]CCH87037.1 exported protein of unknown function [Modestobacter marinus]
MLRSLRCCLNGKVVGALIAVGLLLWLLAPVSGTAALPLLLTLICPLSMGLMMWQMRRPGAGAVPEAGSSAVTTSGDEGAEVAALREELAMERARRQLAERNDQPRD